jgi:hypothetical protein
MGRREERSVRRVEVRMVERWCRREMGCEK